MKNVTLTCPNCHVPDRAVGDPQESRAGYSGRWYCFNCHASGSYTIDFTVIRSTVVPLQENP